MSYKIQFDDILAMQQSTSNTCQQWLNSFESIRSAIQSFHQEGSIEGQAGTSMKNYLQEVHTTLLASLTAIITSYQQQLLLYKDGYFNIDKNNHAVLPEPTYDTLLNELKTVDHAFHNQEVQLQNIASPINDLVTCPVKSGHPIQQLYQDIQRQVKDVKTKVGQYESQHMNDLSDVQQLIQQCQQLINYYAGQPFNVPQTYHTGDIQSVPYIQQFVQAYQTVTDQITARQSQLEQVYHREETRFNQLKQEAIDARAAQAHDDELTAAFVIAAGVIAIIATAGAATPLVVTAGTTFGAGTVLYGSSNFMEAYNSGALAQAGDVNTKAFNPLRDTIFLGHQPTYDAFGHVMTLGAGMMIPISQVSSLMSLGVGFFRSAGTVLTEFMLGNGVENIGGRLLNSATYGFSKQVLELTEASAQYNAQFAQTLGTLATGTLVQKKITKNATRVFKANKLINKHAQHQFNEILERQDSFKNEILPQQLKKFGLTLEEFNELKLKPIEQLTKNEIQTLQAIREAIPMPNNMTVLQKILPYSDLEKFVSGKYGTVGGYVARLQDVAHITDYDDVRETMRLDYQYESDGEMVEPYPKGFDKYIRIEFTTKKVDQLEIPYGKEFGGNNTDDPPAMRNGFLGSRNGEHIPEWRFNDFVDPNEGAKFYIVENGQNKLKAIYDAGEKKFIKVGE